MKRSALLLLCLVGLIAMAGPAAAASANFQGNCAPGIPTFCVFDPNRTPTGGTPTGCTAPATISQLFWDFGDGTSTFASPPPTQIGHTYSTGVQTNVCLTVFCSDGTTSTGCHCFSNQIGVNGCIRNIGSWTP